MNVTLLGVASSTGVPRLLCECKVCRSKNPRNQRLRASAWIEVDGKSFLIDASSDLRQQALQYKIKRIDAIFITHPHSDHIAGVEELRGYNYVQKQAIPVYGNRWTERELKSRYQYIFDPTPAEGGGKPQLDFRLVKSGRIPFKDTQIEAIPVQHGSETGLGYRIKNVAYITDCHAIPPASMEKLRGLEVLILDCLRVEPHPTHLNLEQALAVVSELQPKRTFFTHLGHEMDYVRHNKLLPKNVSLAYDGLKLKKV